MPGRACGDMPTPVSCTHSRMRHRASRGRPPRCRRPARPDRCRGAPRSRPASAAPSTSAGLQPGRHIDVGTAADRACAGASSSVTHQAHLVGTAAAPSASAARQRRAQVGDQAAAPRGARQPTPTSACTLASVLNRKCGSICAVSKASHCIQRLRRLSAALQRSSCSSSARAVAPRSRTCEPSARSGPPARAAGNPDEAGAMR